MATGCEVSGDAPLPRARIVDGLLAAARTAGRAILAVYATDFDARRKADTSPVTDADEQAEAIIIEALRALTPEIPIVAEESAAAGNIPDTAGGRFWLVDPLDGTREFLSRNGEFTVNIALVEQGRPTIGVVFAPVPDRLYWTDGANGAFRQLDGNPPERIAVRRPDAAGLVVVASRSHRDARTDRHIAGLKVLECRPAGSSLKFCLVAEGSADHYPRFGRTMEWDTAAGHAVLAAAGGRVVTTDGIPLAYGKPGFENPDFIAAGG